MIDVQEYMKFEERIRAWGASEDLYGLLWRVLLVRLSARDQLDILLAKHEKFGDYVSGKA